MDARGIFPKREEWIHLGLPFFFFALVGYELWAAPPLSISDHEVGRLFVKFFFLNHVHVFFTFFILFRTEAGRGWLGARWAGGRTRASLLLGIGLCVWMQAVFFAPTIWGTLGRYQLLLFALYGLHHQMYQTYGLGRLYWKTNRERTPNASLALLEGRLQHALYALVLGAFAWRGFMPGAEAAWRGELFFAGLVLAAGVFASALVNEGMRITPRVIYMARIFLYPLMLVSVFAVLGEMAIHGVGYLFVFRKYLKNSGHRETAASWALATFVIGVLASLHLANYSIFRTHVATGTFLDDPALLRWIVMLSTSFSFLHYYLDGILFRSGDPDSRERILKHLVAEFIGRSRS